MTFSGNFMPRRFGQDAKPKLRLPWDCECGGKMEFQGAGSRHVEGEVDPIHTQFRRCSSCGRTDFAPKFAQDMA